MKKYFIFATKREAQEILEKCQLVESFSKESKLYQWEASSSFIFICGMGLENAKKNFRSFLSYKNYDIKNCNFINLGISGACAPDLSLQTVYHISTVSNEDNEKIDLSPTKKNFKSLVSVQKAIWEREQKDKLYSQGFDCIDMEAFALAHCLKAQRKNLRVIKIISDFCYKESERRFKKSIKVCSLILKKIFLELR